MNIEAPSPLYEDKNWDIAVACDINLNRYFGNKDGLPRDSFLDISSFAIASTLNSLDGETSSGSILFTAVDNSALNSEPNKLRSKDLNTFGNCTYQGENHAEVNVVVAGVMSASDRDKFNLYERPDKAKQATAVHELSHVLDIRDKQMQSSILRHDRRHKLRLIAPTLIAYFGIGITTYESVGLLTDNYYIKAGSAALSQALGSIVNIQTIDPKLAYKQYSSRPNEVKAREAEKDADKHPPIISFITNRTERNTNIDYNLINDWA